MENKLHVDEPIIHTPNEAQHGLFADCWVLPFEGTVETPEKENEHEDLLRAFPSKYTVTATQYKKGMYDNHTREAFTWRKGEREFTTQYWGDSVYYVIGKLDDGLYAKYCVDTCLKNCGDELGNMIADAVLEAIETENEYAHVIEYDCYGNENISRGNRLIEKVSLEKLLSEKADLEQWIAKLEEKKELSSKKDFFDRIIWRRKLELRELELMIDQK